MENTDKDKQKKPQFGDEADVSNSSYASRYALLTTDGASIYSSLGPFIFTMTFINFIFHQKI